MDLRQTPQNNRITKPTAKINRSGLHDLVLVISLSLSLNSTLALASLSYIPHHNIYLVLHNFIHFPINPNQISRPPTSTYIQPINGLSPSHPQNPPVALLAPIAIK